MAQVAGYPLVFGSRASLGDFDEVVLPTAYDPDAQDDVVLLVNHDSGKPVARRSARTLILTPDRRGLYADAHANEQITFVSDALLSIRSGTANGASFGFYTDADLWSVQATGRPLRELVRIRLLEVSMAVVFPVYAAAGWSAVRAQPPARPRDDRDFWLQCQ